MNDLELIKSKIDIVSFLSDYIALKKAGRNFKANCPFHQEKTPSFIVSPERQSWHCFGACGIGGDIFDFLMKWENLEFSEAIKTLAQRAGVTLRDYQPTEKTKEKERYYSLNHLASEFYHYILTSHPLGQKAQEYLKDRGLRQKTIETFRLGYSPNSWDALFKFLTKKGFSREEIYAAGFLVKGEQGGVYDRFRGRLMFTLVDHRGNIVGFSGRKLPPDNEHEAKYINSPETPVYVKGNTLYGLNVTKEAIKKENEAIIVEGEFDMLSSFQEGVSNIVAIKGSALTEGQTVLLKRFTENITLALDSDLAGDAAARRGIEIADRAGFNLKVVRLLYGKDPDECIKKDPLLWKKSVSQAVPIYDYIIESSLAKYNFETAAGKKKISDEVLPFLSQISNDIVSSHYVKLFAKKLGVTEEAVLSAVAKQKKTEKVGSFVEKEKPKSVTRLELLEEHLLTLVLQHDDPRLQLEEIFSRLSVSDFTVAPIKKIFELLKSYFRAHKEWNVQKFSHNLSPEVLPTFDRCYLVDINSLITDEEKYAKELKTTIRDLIFFLLKRRINENTTKLARLDQDDQEDTEKVREKVQGLISELKKVEKEV